MEDAPMRSPGSSTPSTLPPGPRLVATLGIAFLAGWMTLLAGAPLAALGPPVDTFTLPPASGNGGLYYPDLQASFPGVDWATLDRLYIQADHYRFINLGGLPVRSADRPLVITNLGGQVRVGGLDFHYNFIVSGGEHWILTGRYDGDALTGDPTFRGHAGGAYANSRDTYGILIDDAFEDTGNSGLGVGGGASHFEIEFLEIRKVGFAGAVVKSDDMGEAHMVGVRFHDTYIHDTGSEGVYFGSTQAEPQHRIEGLRFYNNRIIRAGTEMLQLGQLGDDCEIYNNVFFLGALDWKDPFQGFQDNASQVGARMGSGSMHHNVIIGGAGSFLQFFPQPRGGDGHQAGDLFDVHHNYFSHSRSFGAYLHAQSDTVTTYRFANNAFRDLNFHYDELDPVATNRNAVFVSFNTQSPFVIVDNLVEGPQAIFTGTNGPNFTISGNVNGTVPLLAFLDSGFAADFDYHRIEIWANISGISGQPVEYQQGDFVLHEGTLYECIAPGTHTGREPPSFPGTWAPRPLPPDDVRLAPGSPWQGYGLLDRPVIFQDGFDLGDTSAWDAAVGGV